jgi:hypothetical protein
VAPTLSNLGVIEESAGITHAIEESVNTCVHNIVNRFAVLPNAHRRLIAVGVNVATITVN